MSKTTYQHDFSYSYGEEVSPELAKKVMDDVYKAVKYKKALEEISTLKPSSYGDFPVKLTDSEMFHIAKRAIE
ncbi:hypothetical protein IH781_01055 [Patescibacteria group bacterium]|nr:hypothetical protein [Patescibacteria group bacterium]